jgi:hypothetical protein
MPKREDDQLAKLIRKNVAKVKPPKEDQAVKFDPTLRQRSRDEDPETKRLFKEMKRREF